jgi:MFS transporter, DHA2 family, multidrug resistance protein
MTQITRGRWWALAAVAASFLVVGLDSYIVVTALPTFSAKLGASTSQLQWITTAYSLAGAAVMLPAGQFGDKLGRRRVLLAGVALFGVSSVIASQVSTAGGLIAMRAVMGAGGAVIMPMGQAIIPSLFPGETERRKAVTVTTIIALASLPLGPLLGGWMLSHFAWGWIFLVNAPVSALALVGVWRFVPESRDPANPRLDWLGTVLSAVGITGVIYAIIEAPGYGWDVPVLASLLGGAMLLGVFAWRQRGLAAPLADLRLFRNRQFGWATIAFGVVSFAQAGMLFVLTPYLQGVQGADAQGTGLRLLPMIAGLIGAAACGEGLGSRIGAKFVIPAGMVLSAAGLAVLTGAPAGPGYGVVALATVVFGAGLGLALPLAADAVLGTLAPHQQGMGNALSRAVQRVGIALGTAVLGSLLNSAYRNGLAGHLGGLPAGARGAATSSIAAARELAGRLTGQAGSPLLRGASSAYLHGMTIAALVCAGTLVVSAAACLIFLPRERDRHDQASKLAKTLLPNSPNSPDCPRCIGSPSSSAMSARRSRMPGRERAQGRPVLASRPWLAGQGRSTPP